MEYDAFGMPPDPGPIPGPVYCTKCGSKLRADDRRTSYDGYTGKPVYANITQQICHNRDCHDSPKYSSGGW